MLKLILLLIIIYLLAFNPDNKNEDQMVGDICFGNCGCETEKMCSFHSETSKTPQVCAPPEFSPPSCTQAKFLETMMLKCKHKDDGCAHYMQPQLEDSYGFQVSKCGSCSGATDFISSPEPKDSYPQLPPIAPEVLPVGYFQPTALTYERVEPPRNFASSPPLDALRYSGGETFLNRWLPSLFPSEKCCGEKFFPSGDYMTAMKEGVKNDSRNNSKIEHASNALENSKPVVILYKTEWCHFCSNMKPIFEKVSKDASNTGIVFKVIDCDETPVAFVKSYPTIIYTDTAGKSYKYSGRADYQQLLKFVLSPNH